MTYLSLESCCRLGALSSSDSWSPLTPAVSWEGTEPGKLKLPGSTTRTGPASQSSVREKGAVWEALGTGQEEGVSFPLGPGDIPLGVFTFQSWAFVCLCIWESLAGPGAGPGA